ncbi:gelsolin-related protein of 125 kDa-like [Periplaneta americana]|uniref:gelsolin-related protein of 125 kDa-like n=1 Tax=Periplaneta americana TaxID=6978 RepID=UPI0037E785BE
MSDFKEKLRGESPEGERQRQNTRLPSVRQMVQCDSCKAIGRRESVEQQKVKQMKLDVKEGKGTQETKTEEKEQEIKKKENRQEIKEQDVMEEQNATEELHKNMLRSVVDSSVEEDLPVV